jgi:hypothetical protein
MQQFTLSQACSFYKASIDVDGFATAVGQLHQHAVGCRSVRRVLESIATEGDATSVGRVGLCSVEE